jgi:hypothetical protein
MFWVENTPEHLIQADSRRLKGNSLAVAKAVAVTQLLLVT